MSLQSKLSIFKSGPCVLPAPDADTAMRYWLMPKAVLRESIYKTNCVIGEWAGKLLIYWPAGKAMHPYLVIDKHIIFGSEASVIIRDVGPVCFWSNYCCEVRCSTPEDLTKIKPVNVTEWNQSDLTDDEIKLMHAEIGRSGWFDIEFTENNLPRFKDWFGKDAHGHPIKYTLKYNGTGHWIDSLGRAFGIGEVQKLSACYGFTRYDLADGIIKHLFYKNV